MLVTLFPWPFSSLSFYTIFAEVNPDGPKGTFQSHFSQFYGL